MPSFYTCRLQIAAVLLDCRLRELFWPKRVLSWACSCLLPVASSLGLFLLPVPVFLWVGGRWLN